MVMDLQMDIDTSKKQRNMFCTWGDAVIQRAMSWAMMIPKGLGLLGFRV